MRDRLKNLLSPTRGATMTDYGILIAVISLLSLAGVVLTGGSVREVFDTTAEHMPNGEGEYVLPKDVITDIALDYDLPEGSMVLAFEGQQVDLFLEKAEGAGEAFLYWRDGPKVPITESGTFSHIYLTGEEVNYVGVTGDISSFRSESNNLVEVLSFGTLPLTSLERAFENDYGLLSVSALPRSVTNISYAFASTDQTLGSDPIGVSAWKTGRVTDFSYAFYKNSMFNQDVSNWNVRAADREGMAYMFGSSGAFVGDLGTWCVEQVQTEPDGFGAPFAERHPAWGHCGMPKVRNNPDALVFTVEGASTEVAVSGAEDGLATIYWGDETVSTNVVAEGEAWTASHSYAEPGSYKVQVEMAGKTDAFAVLEDSVTAVDQWGTGMTDLTGAFAGMVNIASLPQLTDTIATLDGMFAGVEGIGANPEGVSGWNVSNVTSMQGLVQDNPAFDQDLSSWNIASINALGDSAGGNALKGAFSGATGLTADLGEWCVDRIITVPDNFGAPNAERQPTWGYCGTPDQEANPDALMFTAEGSSVTFMASGTADGLATVFWGDGTIGTQIGEAKSSLTFTHSYKEPGTYQVQVELPETIDYFRVLEDTIVSVDQWGTGLTDLTQAFEGMSQIASVAPLPETATKLFRAFAGDNNKVGPNPAGIGAWDVSNVEDMQQMFHRNHDFDQDISGWDITRINDSGTGVGLSNMFNDATGLTADLGEWCVDKIMSAPQNFGAPNAERQPVWGYCGTPEAEENSDALMLTVDGASASISVKGHDSGLATVYWGDDRVSTANVTANSATTFSHAYSEAGTYQVQVEIPGNASHFQILEDTVTSVDQWGPSLTSLYSSFENMTQLATVPPLPATVTSLQRTFYGNLDEGPNPAGVAEWDVSHVTNFFQMARYNPSFDADVSDWEVSAVNAMGSNGQLSYMFDGADGVTADLGNWCVDNLPSQPTGFGAPNAERQPVWGYCGTPEVQENPDALMFTVDGATARFKVTAPAAGLATVYWGDGGVSTAVMQANNAWTAGHSYAEAGTYQVQVEVPGNASHFQLLHNTVTSIDQWGPSLTSLYSSFENMTQLATVPPLPATVTSLQRTFYGNLDEGPNPAGVAEWDVSHVTNFFQMARYNPSFDADVSDWEVSAVNAMGSNGQLSYMFDGADGVTADLGNWCVDNLPSQPTGFGARNAERQPVWGYCGTPEVQENPDALMFTVDGATARFKVTAPAAGLATVYWGDGGVSTEVMQANNAWTAGHSYAQAGTYQVQVEVPGNASHFQLLHNTVTSIDQWGPSLTSLYSSFENMTQLASVPPLPATVTSLQRTFYGDLYEGPNPAGVAEWDVSHVTNFFQMARYNPSFDADVSDWDVAAVNAMGDNGRLRYMFDRADGVTSDLGNWCVDNLPSQPTGFGAPNAERQPVWGYCGTPEVQENPDALMFTVDGATARFKVTAPAAGLATVYWGDGGVSTEVMQANNAWTAGHSYAEAGTYQVQVEVPGNVSHFQLLHNTVTSIDQWGPSLTSLSSSFENMTQLASVPPLPATVTSLNRTFYGDLYEGPNPAGVAEWDVSHVTNFFQMARYNPSFDADVSDWDVAAVNAMGDNGRLRYMFDGADGVTADLGNWCVDNLPSQPTSFGAPNAERQPVWGYCGVPTPQENPDAILLTVDGASARFKVSGLADGLATIYWGDGAVDTGNLSASNSWTAGHTYEAPGTYEVQVEMAGKADAFSLIQDTVSSIDQWNEGLVDLSSAFEGMVNLQSVPPLPSSVENLSRAFAGDGLTGPNPAGVSSWDVSGVRNFYELARDNPSFDADVSGWQVTAANATGNNYYLRYAFSGATGLASDLSGWCVDKLSEPTDFGAPNAAKLPAWGYCGWPEFDDEVIGDDAYSFTIEGGSASLYIETRGETTVHWGIAGKTTTLPAGYKNTVSFTYGLDREYLIQVTGEVDQLRIVSNNTIAVEQWGDVGLTTLANAFQNDRELISVPDHMPAGVTSLYRTFMSGGNPAGLETWDVSAVTNMTELFASNGTFTGDISNWCVPQFSTEPSGFGALNAKGTPAWGFCGQPSLEETPDATVLTVQGTSATLRMRSNTNGTGMILWGDGKSTITYTRTDRDADYAHSYDAEGTYKVTLLLPGQVRNFRVIEDTVIAVDQFSPETIGLYYAFQNNSRLERVAALPPKVSGMYGTFSGATGPGNVAGLESWDTSGVTTMALLAQGNPNFDSDISSWDVSKITNLDSAFSGATGFTGHMKDWCVSQFTSEPSDFGAVNAASQPAWGYCGTPALEDLPDATILTVEGGSATFEVSPKTTGTGLIMWGDGQTSTQYQRSDQTYTVSHTYAEEGAYQVTFMLSGNVQRLHVMEDTVVSVDQWSPTVTSLYQAFKNMSRVGYIAPIPPTVTQMAGAFSGATGPNPTGLEAWDTGNVVNMDDLVSGNPNFDANISTWDTSSVTRMDAAFYQATGFTGELKDWCVTNISSQPGNFGAPNAASHPAWGYCGMPDLSEATMVTVQGDKASFILKPNTSGTVQALALWGDGKTSTLAMSNRSNYTMSHDYDAEGTYQVALLVPTQFNYFRAFEDTVVSVDQWSPGLRNLNLAFKNMSRVKDIAPIPASVTTMVNIFEGADGPNPTALEDWDTGNVTQMRELALNNPNFNSDISSWDVSSVVNLDAAFSGATGFTGDMKDWCVSAITSEPTNFGAPNAASHPAWGYCGTPDLEDLTEATILTIEGDSASFRFKSQSSGTGLVLWGDGQTSTVGMSNSSLYTLSHTYLEAGTYQAAILLPGQPYHFKNLEDTVVSVDQWSPLLRDINGAFENMSKLGHVAPIPSTLTTMQNTFAGASGPNPTGLDQWDTSNVQLIHRLALDNPNFNADVSGWDLTSMTGMDHAFNGASGFTGHLKDWCVTQFSTPPTGFGADNAASHPAWGYCGAPDTDEQSMILTIEGDTAELRLQPVSNGTNLILWGDGQTDAISLSARQDWYPSHSYATPGPHEVKVFMSGGVNHFRAIEDTVTRVDQWSSTTGYLDHAFNGKSAIEYVAPLPARTVKLAYMFAGTGTDGLGANPAGLSAWDMSRNSLLNSMFEGNPTINQDLSGWDVSSATNMNSMFDGATGYTGDLEDWCVTGFTSTPAGFGAPNAASQPFWGFCGADALGAPYKMTVKGDAIELYLATREGSFVDWGDGQGTYVNEGYAYYVNHTFPADDTYQIKVYGELDRITNRHTSKIMVSVDDWGDVGLTSMKYGFSNEAGLVSLPATLPPTVTDLYAAFANGTNRPEIVTWDVSNVTNMDLMLNGNTDFVEDLSGWCVANINSAPTDFGAPNGTHPVWGTCP